MALTGGCNCGNIRYEVTGEPMATVVCHCKNCQLQAGGPFSVVAVYPADAIRVEGQVKVYEDYNTHTGDVLHREFCPECGSPLFSRQPHRPEIVSLKTGTLDDTSSIKPQMHIFTRSAQTWVKLDPDLPQFEGQPEGL